MRAGKGRQQAAQPRRNAGGPQAATQRKTKSHARREGTTASRPTPRQRRRPPRVTAPPQQPQRRRTRPQPCSPAAANAPGLKKQGRKLVAFTRMDSSVVSRETAHREDAASNDRTVADLFVSSGRDTRSTNNAVCPTEKPPTPAFEAGKVADEAEAKEEVRGAGEASRRGDEARLQRPGPRRSVQPAQ